MPITDLHMNLGSFEVAFSPTIPRSLRRALAPYGHLIVTPGHLPAELHGDGLLSSASYVGVVRASSFDAISGNFTVTGAGLATWLGDDNGKGPIIYPDPLFFGTRAVPIPETMPTFAEVVRAILPDAYEGTIHSVGGTYSGLHYLETVRSALDYVCETFGAEWRVRNDGKWDLGTAAQLFGTTPKAVISRRDPGRDFDLAGLPAASLSLNSSGEEIPTRVLLVAEGQGPSSAVEGESNETLVTGEATIPSNPYFDLHGNPADLTVLIDEPETAGSDADHRAQIHLDDRTVPRRELSVSTRAFDVEGAVTPGEYVWVFDPDAGLVDATTPVRFRGETIYPVALRVLGITSPISSGMGVYYRSATGDFTDLTHHVQMEDDAETSFELGSLPRTLTSLQSGDVVNRVKNAPTSDAVSDTTMPGTPTGLTLVDTGNTTDANGLTRSYADVSWTEPLNTDTSTVTDGDHFELRLLRTSAPIAEPVSLFVGWDFTDAHLPDLDPGASYSVFVRAVDANANASPFSDALSFTADADTTPPSTPASPSGGGGSVAGNPLSIQVTSTLGKSTGGTYNLEPDLDHLDVHVGPDELFTPTSATKVGELPATRSNLSLGVPSVGSFPAPDTTPRHIRLVAVDRSGNFSPPSVAATVSALLIESQHITDAAITNAHIANATITHGKILSLDADDIVTGYLGAQFIEAESITGDKLAANTITTRSLVVGSFDNLASNPGFETGNLKGWTVAASGTAAASWTGTAGVVSQPTSTRQRSGNHGMYVSTGGTTDAPSPDLYAFIGGQQDGVVPPGGTTGTSDPSIWTSAREGDKHYISAWIGWGGQSQPGLPTVRCYISYRNRTGGNLASYTSAAGVSGGAGVVDTKIELTSGAAAPVGTAYVLLGFYIPPGQTVSGTIYIDDVYARILAGSAIIDQLLASKITVGGTTTLASWSSGSDATFIDGGRIYADSITATQIAANTITGNEIKAGSVQADRIGAGTITAAVRISAGTLDSTTEVGMDVGAATALGYDGLSMAPHFDNCFMRFRDTGRVFFRVNRGGANAIEFDSGGTAPGLTIKGTISASVITGSTVTGSKVLAGVDPNIVEVGEAAGGGAWNGISMQPHYTNCFVRNSAGRVLFRVNSGGANSILFDSTATPALTVKGTISASTITGSTITASNLSIGGDFDVTTSGALTARSATFQSSVTIDLESATTFNYWRRGGTIRGRMLVKEPTTYDHLFLCTQYTGLKLLNSTNVEIQARNYADTAYAKMVASEFLVQSARETKRNVKAVANGLGKLASIPVHSYQLNEDTDDVPERYGFMIDEAPAGTVEPTYDEQGGIRLYSLIALTVKAVQEMAERIPPLQTGAVTELAATTTGTANLAENPTLVNAALKGNTALVG